MHGPANVKFKVVLQKFLHENSFYSLEEYFVTPKS